MSNWRVMLSGLWDQKKYANLWNTQSESRRIAQSKGTARMITFPKRGDTVDFVLKGAIVMQGVIDSDSFERGTWHQEHSCNIGDHRPHAENPEFIWVKINAVNLNIPVRKTGQRTWLKIQW